MLWKPLSLQIDEQGKVKICACNKFKRQNSALGGFLCLADDQPENTLFSPSAQRYENWRTFLQTSILILFITKSPYSVGANQSIGCDLGTSHLCKSNSPVFIGTAPGPSSAPWNHTMSKGLKPLWRLWSLEWIILGTDELSSRHQRLLPNTMGNEMLSRPGGATQNDICSLEFSMV